MHFLRGLVLGALLTVGAPATLGAQDDASTHHAVWLVYGGDHAVRGRFGLVFDGQMRLMQDAPRERQLLLRPGLSLRVADRLRLATGYGVMMSRDDSGDPLVPRRPEHRLWVLAQLVHPLGPLALSHRTRLEHRWLSGMRVGPTGQPLGETWVTAERLRYNIRAAIPIATLGGERGVAAVLSDELFASFGGYAGDFAVDQNRATAALGVHISPVLRVEVGYMLQTSAANDGRMNQRNHVMQIGLASSVALH